MKIILPTMALTFWLMGLILGQAQNVTKVDDSHVVPVSLQDPTTKVIFYLESDGRRISAITPDGKLLWTEDVFVKGDLKPYRVARPIITTFAINHNIAGKIQVAFNSSQYAQLDQKTGEVEFSGQY